MVELEGVHMQHVDPAGPLSSAALVGICLAATLFLVSVAAVSCFCYKKRGSQPHKLIYRRPPDKSLGLKKPTALRSPGSQGHYLKKSPSPPGSRPAGSPNIGDQQPATEKSPVLHTPSPSEEQKIRSVTCYTENEQDSSLSGGELQPLQEHQSTKDEKETKLGQLHFRVRYSSERAVLLVTIVKCVGLRARTGSAGSDPYVKLQLLPARQHRVKTRVLRNTQDPVYEEDFTFYGIQYNQLESTTLHFVVLSFDRYSRDDVIGEVLCPMAGLDVSESEEVPLDICREIAPRSIKMRSQGRGELLVSLCHQPAANRLTVVVLKARNLPKMDITGLSDPYVKIYLICNGQRITKKKTHVKKRTLNPVFNESFVFELPPGNDTLQNVRLEFMLLDWDRVTKNEVIGRLELGSAAADGKRLPSAVHHWNEIVNSPRRQIAEWHKLTE